MNGEWVVYMTWCLGASRLSMSVSRIFLSASVQGQAGLVQQQDQVVVFGHFQVVEVGQEAEEPHEPTGPLEALRCSA
jgi:hypothetical protein